MCPYCKDNQFLEIRVQLDQKIYIQCVCVQGIHAFAREVFAVGYKRCQDDEKVMSRLPDPPTVK